MIAPNQLIKQLRSTGRRVTTDGTQLHVGPPPWTCMAVSGKQACRTQNTGNAQACSSCGKARPRFDPLPESVEAALKQDERVLILILLNERLTKGADILFTMEADQLEVTTLAGKQVRYVDMLREWEGLLAKYEQLSREQWEHEHGN